MRLNLSIIQILKLETIHAYQSRPTQRTNYVCSDKLILLQSKINPNILFLSGSLFW